MPKKKHMNVTRWLTYAFIPASFAYLLVGFNQGLSVYDEGVAVYGAVSVLHGEALYRDFFTGYGPAQFYLLAGLFKLFGISIIVERIASICFMWLMCFSAYLVAKRLVSPGLALLAWVLIVVRNFGIVPGFPAPMPNIMLFAFLGCLCMFNFMSGKHAYWMLLSGLCAGMVAIFRHDFAIYAMLAGMAASTVYILACLHPECTSVPRRLTSVVGLEIGYLLAAAVVIVPVAFLILAGASRQDVIFPLAVVPLKLYARYFSLPYPMPPNPQNLLNGSISLRGYAVQVLKVVPFWLPVLVYIVSTILIANRDWRIDTRQHIAKWLPTALVLLLGVAYWNYARIRSDIPHVLPTFTVSVIMLAVLVQNIPVRGKFSRPLYVLAVLVCVSSIVVPLKQKASTARASASKGEFALTLDHGRGVYLDNGYARYEDAVRYVQKRTGKDERIFVGCSRHDRLRTNDAMFYVLADRRSATRYSELHRAVACTATCQQEIVHDIRAHHVRYIVLREEGSVEDCNASSRSSGVTILDDFIRGGYRSVATFNDYSIWKKKEDATAHRS